MLEGLNSRHDTFGDWNQQFLSTARPGYNASNLDIGAERILHRIFSFLEWKPNSAPVGSDLFFETKDAFVHIDVKTALLTNPADHEGRINVGRNQSSYPAHRGTGLSFSPNLPKYYREGTPGEKPCLTYAIHIIHENDKRNVLAILLISIPNGQLFDVYENLIVNRGKSAFYPPSTRNVKDFRFTYYRMPKFRLLGKPWSFRVEFIHFDNSLNPGVRKVDIVRNPRIP